eukprot:9170494-Alexandrium_andersonii.AAC.1
MCALAKANIGRACPMIPSWGLGAQIPYEHSAPTAATDNGSSPQVRSDITSTAFINSTPACRDTGCK